MPGIDGLQVLEQARTLQPEAAAVIMTAYATVDTAVEAMKLGAYDYLVKPFDPEELSLMIQKIVSQQALVRENVLLRKVLKREYRFRDLISKSPGMQAVFDLARTAARSSSTILILGESGTGKEVIANAIHRLSRRRDMPFIAVNCAALPEQLLESEMFGHLKGAFTGADGNKRGLFEEADGGTIFLDEVGEMSLATQAKLLRVLQNGEIRPVGSSTSSHVDVRVLAATNRNLEEAVAERRFREDLYFRLNVIQVRIPPLRERLDALPQLVGHFVTQMSRTFGKRIQGFDEQAQAYLRNYTYPGNVRELESIIAHAIIMADDDVIRARDLPDQVRAGGSAPFALPHYAADTFLSLKEMEEQLIRQTLHRLDGSQTEAAARLGISRSTLWRKMKEYGISAG
jgi:DNA-binding NtrC family response regulator